MEGFANIFCGLFPREMMIIASLIHKILEEIKEPSDYMMMVLSDFWDLGGFFLVA